MFENVDFKKAQGSNKIIIDILYLSINLYKIIYTINVKIFFVFFLTFFFFFVDKSQIIHASAGMNHSLFVWNITNVIYQKL